MVSKFFQWNNGHVVNKVWYPRVTSICSIIAKPGLERWLADQQSYYAMQRKRKKITDWGKEVHDTVEKILVGRLPRINPAIRPSIDAFLEWFKKHRVDTMSIEKRVLSQEHVYSGTLDVVAKVDGQLGIIDLKTSTEIWDDYFIQTAAYFNAYNEKNKEKAGTFWILRIDQFQQCQICGGKRREKAGEPEIKKGKKDCLHKWGKKIGECQFQQAQNNDLYFETFLTAKKLWEFSNRRSLSQINNYPGLVYDKQKSLFQ